MEDPKENSQFYAKYSDKEYELKVSLYNDNGDIVYINNNAILSLIIEDNIFNPFHTGQIIISNDLYVIENNPYSSYAFQGNGRDILDIELIPLATGRYQEDLKDEGIDEFLSMKFKFVITKAIDSVFNNSKCRQLEFVEYSQYVLNENMCNIFDVYDAITEKPSLANSNQANSRNTGLFIKAILECAFLADSDELIDKDQEGNYIFEGDDSKSINLNPHVLYTYADALNYVLEYHSYNGSPCVLNFDRYTKKFRLVGLNSLFKDHDKYLHELLYFPSASRRLTKKSPTDWDTSKVSFKESKINEFYIDSPTSKHNIVMGSNGCLINTSGVYKSMFFDLESLNSDHFTRQYYDLFCMPFASLFGGFQLIPNYYLTPNKRNNYYTYEDKLPQELSKDKFMNKKLLNLLYMNNTYQFKLEGMTNRQPMTFVDVIKYVDNDSNQEGNSDSKPSRWDMDHLGRHFVVSVKHVFQNNKYTNIVETIKPYRMVDSSDKNGDILQTLNNFGILNSL